MSDIELPVLQHQSHIDISSPDPLDGLVHPSERHDIDDGPDAMLRRKLEHVRGIGTTAYVVAIDRSPGIVQQSTAQRQRFQRRRHQTELAAPWWPVMDLVSELSANVPPNCSINSRLSRE